MKARTVLYLLLLVVAAAAAVLSFAALRDLALTCGFAAWLAWLLPVVVDAGAASGSLVWLGGWAALSARRFARTLALTLLGLSVAANALGHGLAAFSLAPPWWVVVVVSAIAPAVLGAVVHLAVLVGRPAEPATSPRDDDDEDDLSEVLDEHGLSRYWDHAPPTEQTVEQQRVEQLIAAGVGRRRLSRELEISEYEARLLLERTRNQPQRTGQNDDAESDVDEHELEVNGAVLTGMEGRS
ncbi:DUF2637 domain-containing protein [Pseudonocardia sp. GCM10023141]|uniref:DUF2637 domain-containing protein n=1 Tax=Pseudonocardia sp. GCM10023141 TaxID=3252653 RepID=UPI003615A9CE